MDESAEVDVLKFRYRWANIHHKFLLMLLLFSQVIHTILIHLIYVVIASPNCPLSSEIARGSFNINQCHLDYLTLNPLRPSDAYMRRLFTIIGTDNGLRLVGAKPSSESMLEYC